MYPFSWHVCSFGQLMCTHGTVYQSKCWQPSNASFHPEGLPSTSDPHTQLATYHFYRLPKLNTLKRLSTSPSNVSLLVFAISTNITSIHPFDQAKNIGLMVNLFLSLICHIQTKNKSIELNLQLFNKSIHFLPSPLLPWSTTKISVILITATLSASPHGSIFPFSKQPSKKAF